MTHRSPPAATAQPTSGSSYPSLSPFLPIGGAT
jgi:hypothetical protein